MLLRNSIRFTYKLCSYQQHRTATVFKRFKTPPRLPPNATQEQINQVVFTDDYEYFRYETVKETDAEPNDIKIILLKSSEEFGKRGQILTLNARIARQELLLPGLAVYASPENLNKYENITIAEDAVSYSSSTVRVSMSELKKMVVPLVMSGQHHWNIEPKHIKFAFLSQGIIVDESNITLPDVLIKGPDPTVIEKEFGVDVKINDFEKVTIRCVLFEQPAPNDLGGMIPPHGWEKRFYPPLITEQADLLRMLPRHKLSAEDVSTMLDGKKILEEYLQWKSERDKRLFST